MRIWLICILFFQLLCAQDSLPKRTLNPDMTLTYHQLPDNVDNPSQIFAGGQFYGRLRLHTFLYDAPGVPAYYTLGVGGSMLYKSAYWQGWGMTAGLYTTQNPIHMDDRFVYFYRSARGVLSRQDVVESGRYGITSLAQAYLEYRTKNSSFKAGRQIFESMLTKSNDTKMIPNTFEGYSYNRQWHEIQFKGAYLLRQKLRDHSSFHHLLAYDGWRENDDSAMHRGLTLAKLQAKGIKDRLRVAEITQKGRFSWLVNLTDAPRLFTIAALEGSYRYQVGRYQVIPSLRYLRQFDNGAGEIGGASLYLDTTGYKDPDSVQSDMTAARVDVVYRFWRIRAGYSAVADMADLITPWRGFPTGGYTRAMGQYNWYAGTRSWMLRGDYDLAKAEIAAGVRVSMRYVVQDFDDQKPAVPADSRVLTLDLHYRFTCCADLYTKLRLAHVEGKKDTIAQDGMRKPDPSYDELRFEINYLF